MCCIYQLPLRPVQVGYLILHQDLTLTFFVRNVLYPPEKSEPDEPLIHGTHSQRISGAIFTLFFLTMETLAAQMPAAFNLISSRSSDDYWSQPQNPSYLVGSAFAQQWPNYMGRPLNSLSTKGLLSPYDSNLSPFPTSMSSSGVQQQQRMNASQQHSSQSTQQDFIQTPDHYSGLSPLTPTSSSRPLSFPLMKQSPNTSPAPSDRISSLSSYSHSNVGQQNDRPFKCDQCPQSFNRNHDLKRHKRIHLAVKPFPCGHCEKSFSRKDALKVRS
jgi:hypothetical protein